MVFSFCVRIVISSQEIFKMLNRLFIILIFLNLGCSNGNKNKSESQNDTISESVPENISHSIGEVLSPEAREIVDSWKEYTQIENMMVDYYNISIEEAIINAQELSNATLQFKDSIRVDRFKEPDLKMRLNILNNIALRLNDMGQIPQISGEEVKNEVSNLVRVFSSINSKLNNILSQENLEKELKFYN